MLDDPMITVAIVLALALILGIAGFVYFLKSSALRASDRAAHGKAPGAASPEGRNRTHKET